MCAQTPRSLTWWLCPCALPSLFQPSKSSICLCHVPLPSDDKIFTELKAQRMRWGWDPGAHWLSSRGTQTGQNQKRRWQLTKGRQKQWEEKYNSESDCPPGHCSGSWHGLGVLSHGFLSWEGGGRSPGLGPRPSQGTPVSCHRRLCGLGQFAWPLNLNFWISKLG